MSTIEKTLGIINLLAWGTALGALSTLTSGCSLGFDSAQEDPGRGGGRDAIIIDMPFATGYQSQCVQGVGDDYTHDGTSTYYDLDLDTPNNVDDSIFAPISGTAYVHENVDGFGNHINLDLGDGTYIVLAHLFGTLVDNGEPVTAGQLIGLEGTTGNSTGDHVHIGRHEGDASQDAGNGTSIDGLSINVYDNATGTDTTLSVHEFTCDLYDGHVYTSRLSTPLWHPNGSLVKTPTDEKVYLLADGIAQHIDDEEVFWSYNFDFDDVMIVDDSELDCYESGNALTRETNIRAFYDGDVWLLVGAQDDNDRYAQRVHSTYWQSTLASWGINVSSYDDLELDQDVLDDYPRNSGIAPFRDGTIVTEESTSDVYFIAGGIATAVYNYDTFLMLDLYGRELMVVDDGAVQAVQEKVGDCTVDSACLHMSDVTTCGGPDDLLTAQGSSDEDVEEEDGMSDDESEQPDEEDADDPDTGDTEKVDESCELMISWEVPDGNTASIITLEMEIEQDGDSYGSWEYSSSTSNAASISKTFELDDNDTKARANITFQYESNEGVDEWGCVSTSSDEDDDELVGSWSAYVVCGEDTESIDVDVYHKTLGVVDGCEAEVTW